MSSADDTDGYDPALEERIPRGWARHPRERMLITPLVAGLGGLVAPFIGIKLIDVAITLMGVK